MPIDIQRRNVLLVALSAVGLGGAALSLEGLACFDTAAAQTDVKTAPSAELRAIFSAQQWLNGSPLGPDDIRGKVVVVNFWTYSCINSLRMLPYTRAWHEKYKDSGLAVIGVHTPEFEFEKDIGNIKRALELYDVSYSVVVDSDSAIWRTFHNEAWPALYFVDANGRIRRRALGEGAYDKSEKLIQQLLTEAKKGTVPGDIVAVVGTGAEAEADWANQRSPETYVGYARATNFASSGGIKRDISNVYPPSSNPALNHWGLGGDWTVGKEFATLNAGSGSVQYRFHARDLHLIMGRSPPAGPINFRVKIDGAPPAGDHGVDVKADGTGTISEDRMYQLIRQTGQIKDRTLEIEFTDTGVRVYDFTFG
jgi:thiol-disulfide isomerase/thioredoxin